MYTYWNLAVLHLSNMEELVNFYLRWLIFCHFKSYEADISKTLNVLSIINSDFKSKLHFVFFMYIYLKWTHSNMMSTLKVILDLFLLNLKNRIILLLNNYMYVHILGEKPQKTIYVSKSNIKSV